MNMHTSCFPRGVRSRRWTSSSICSGAVGGGGAPRWRLVSFSLRLVFPLTTAAARVVGAGGQQRRVEEHAVEQVHELRREQLCAPGKRKICEWPTARFGVVAAASRVLSVLLQNGGDRCRQ